MYIESSTHERLASQPSNSGNYPELRPFNDQLRGCRMDLHEVDARGERGKDSGLVVWDGFRKRSKLIDVLHQF